MMKVWKVLNEDGSACNGGRGKWPLPMNGSPGEWVEVKGTIEPCVRGLHLCRRKNLLTWLGPAIFEAEYEGDVIQAGDKIVVSRARLVAPTRWNERTARLFACDCAARAQRLLRKRGLTPDERSLETIKVARRFANGEASRNELDAARDAARAAAWDAAWAAARDAAVAAARAATWDAAWAAARDAAVAKEREWQTRVLMEYLNGRRG